MIEIDGVFYLEHGDVCEMTVHRGGGYFRDSSIYEGGAWTSKIGVVIVKYPAITLKFDPSFYASGNPNGEPIYVDDQGKKHANVAWVKFFDGDAQATDTRLLKNGFPDGPKTFIRKATEEELRIAEKPWGST